MDGAPFKKGDRVRVKYAFRTRSRKYVEGVVARVTEYSNGLLAGQEWFFWHVTVQCEGAATRRFYVIPDRPCEWELMPLEDWAADTVARSLAQAVLDGDLGAALPLADRVMELCGATPRKEGTG